MTDYTKKDLKELQVALKSKAKILLNDAAIEYKGNLQCKVCAQSAIIKIWEDKHWHFYCKDHMLIPLIIKVFIIYRFLLMGTAIGGKKPLIDLYRARIKKKKAKP